MENDILDSLNDLCYDGPLSDEVALSKALDSGPKSLEYAKLVHILADELKKLCNVEETVNLMNDPDEWSSFILELSSFLKELKCPYKNLTTGHMSSRLQTKEDRILLLDYLISELMAARMVNIDCPKEKNSSGMEIIVQESPVAKDLKEILIALKFNKPPPNITPEMLFSKLEAKLKETIQKEGDQLVGKPLYNKSISEKDWKQLENSFTEMFEEYRLRRETLITRLECTIQSFEWSERLKTKKDSIQSTFRPKREQMKVKPNVKLSDFLAARSALLQVEKTSSASVRKNTQSDVNKVIIGQVPDRGGRPNEQQPPPPEMPSWQQRSAPQVILAQCLKVHQDQVMSSQQCVRPPKRSLPDEEPTRTPKSLKITDNSSAISPKAGPSVALNEPKIWPQIGATNANQVIKEVGPCLVGSVPPNARKTGPQMESPNANQVSKEVGSSPGGSLAPNVFKTGPQTNPSQGTKEMGTCPIGVVAPNAPETGPQMGLVNANQVPKEIAPDMKATNANPFFYRDVLCRVGISNKIPMTNEQLELVRRSILKAIEVSERGTGPQFRGCLLKQGWLLITCEDMRSREWLVRQVGILKPFPGAELSIMAPEQMPKTIIAHVCAPKSEAKTVDQVIKMLRVQNKGMNTQTWKVFNCNDLESALDITVSIDKESAEVLRSVKCKASLGFKQVTFRFKDDKKPSTQPMEQASTSNQPPQSADSPTYIKGN